MGADRETTGLPAWRSVLAVVAHPGDESFGLGALLWQFAVVGTRIGMLCFTHGEASTVHLAARVDDAVRRAGRPTSAERSQGQLRDTARASSQSPAQYPRTSR